MYELKLKNKQIKNIGVLPFNNFEYNNGWIIIKTNMLTWESLGESNSRNVDLVWWTNDNLENDVTREFEKEILKHFYIFSYLIVITLRNYVL